MNKKMEKNYYNAPTVKVVSFIVEAGFEATSRNMNIGIREGQTIIPEPLTPPDPSEGTELFGIRSI